LPSGWCFSVITQDLYDAIKGDPRFSNCFDLKALKVAIKQIIIWIIPDILFKQILHCVKEDVRTGGGAAELNI
jgi:hypothetical protein